MSRETAWLVEVSPGETRAALVDGRGQLIELQVERMGEAQPVGAIHLGRVSRVDSGMGAAFVEIGEVQPGFIGKAKKITEGEKPIVQVIRAAGGGKGAVVTLNPLLTGRYLILDPTRPGIRMPQRWEGDKADMATRLEAIAPEGCGLTPREAAADIEDSVLRAEAERLLAGWRAMEAAAKDAKPPAELAPAPGLLDSILCDAAGPVTIDDPRAFAAAETRVKAGMPDLKGNVGLYKGDAPLFEETGVEEQIEAALSPRIEMPSGASLVIEETEALTAIDVNMGGSGGRLPSEAAILKANQAAVREIARQIRLRNIGGLIVIDFISMRNKGNRRTVTEAMRRDMKGDPVRHDVLGMTAAGLVEITRQRTGQPLAALFTRPAGRAPAPLPAAVACAALRAAPRQRWTGKPALVASPEVIAVLKGPMAGALAEVNRRLGQELELRGEAGREGFEIVSG